MNSSHWNGKKYHQNSDQQKDVAFRLLDQWSFNPTDAVLDVGCGDGKITHSIAGLVPSGLVVGADPSESMIEFANNNFASDRVQFILSKACEISQNNQFDVICSFSSLHWEPKQKESLIAFKKALKPHGSLLLAIPGPDMNLRAALKKCCQLPKWAAFFTDYQSPGTIWTVNEYTKLLLETQFVIRKVELVRRTYKAECESKFKGLLDGMLPHLSRLPHEHHHSFIDDVYFQMKAEKKLSSNEVPEFEVNVIEVIAGL